MGPWASCSHNNGTYGDGGDIMFEILKGLLYGDRLQLIFRVIGALVTLGPAFVAFYLFSGILLKLVPVKIADQGEMRE